MYPYIEIFKLKIPSYGLMLVIALLVSALFAYSRLKRENKPLEELIIVSACVIGFGYLFSITLFVFTTFSLRVIKESFFNGNFFLLFRGGIFLGGFIGGLFGLIIGSLIAKTPIFFYETELTPCIPLAHAIGRIGCFLAGCCYGIPTNSKIGFSYTNPIGTAPIGIPLLPIQLIESFFNLIIFFILIIFLRKKRKDGETILLYTILYSILRFFIEFFRFDAIRGQIFIFSTSQFISLILLVLSAIFYLKINRSN